MTENTVELPPIPKRPTGLKAPGKKLWDAIHASADFSGSPETVAVIEQACFLADEINRLQRLIRKAGSDTRVAGYNGQLVSMPEVADLQSNQRTYLAYLKSIRVSDVDDKLTRSEVGRLGAAARYGRG